MMKDQKGCVLVPTAPSHAFTPTLWLKGAVSQIARWQKLHRERLSLASLNDDALKDIGLSRADVYNESERPFWHDPMKH